MLAALLLLGLGLARLPAQAVPPKPASIRVSSESSPEQLATVELNQAVLKGDLARAENALAGAPTLLAEARARQVLLNLAAQEGHPAIVRWLLEKGASPNEAHERVRPLTAAVFWTRDIRLQRQEENPEVWKQMEHLSQAGPSVAPPPVSTPAKSVTLVGIRHMLAPMPPDLLARKAQVVELLLTAGAQPADVATGGTASPPLLYLAAQLGFGAEVITRLIQSGADPGVGLQKTRQTPLHIAAMNGNLGAAEALLAHHVDLESLSTSPLPGPPGMQIASGGTTPLMDAIMLSQEAMVRFLLAQGAQTEATNHTFDRALHFAAMIGHTGILRLLLDRGARVNSSDRWQSTPLHYAALAGHLAAVKILLEARADPEAVDEAGYTPLLNAAEHDRLEVVRFLLAQGASRHARTDAGKGPLRVAATANALLVAEFLLSLGEKADGEPADNLRPLHEAVSSGHPQMVALLLRHGATTEVRDRAMQSTPLYSAIFCRPASIRQRSFVTPAKTSYAKVQTEAPAFLEIVRLLAARGADLNATDRRRNTALHLAAESDDREAAELLLKLGARRDLANDRAMTPSEIASRKGHREIATLLQPTVTPMP